MNRATKRLLAKQQAAEAKRGGGGAAGGGRRAAVGDEDSRRGGIRLERKKRTPPRQFLREVKTELKKVAWPSRKEVATYTAVVLVSVIFLTFIVFGIDFGLSKAIFNIFKHPTTPAG